MLAQQDNTKRFTRKQLCSTLAAFALLSGASASQAQFNNVNTFSPFGPTILRPLGGGVLSNLAAGSPFNSGFNSAVGSGFSSFNNGFNSGFVLPQNVPFNRQLNAFNAQRFVDTTGATNFNSQLANFNAQRTAYNAQFIQQNSALNVPSLNVPGSSNTSVFTGFVPTSTIASPNLNPVGTATNPSINPFVTSNTSFGFSAFNNFNALNNTSGLPVNAAALSTRSFVNNRAAMAARLAPNANQATANSMNTAAYPWPVQPPPQTYPPVLYPLAQQSRTNAAVTNTATSYPWPVQPPPQVYPPVLFIHSPMNIGTGMAGRSAFGSGIAGSAVVLGGRSVR